MHSSSTILKCIKSDAFFGAGCIVMRESIGWDDCISLPHYRESGGAGKGSTVFNLQDNVLMNVMMML